MSCPTCNDTGTVETYTRTIEYGLPVYDGDAPCPECHPDNNEVPF